MLLVVLYFFTIPYLIEGKDDPLYHSTDVLPENAKRIRQLPILEVPSNRSCNITKCHSSTADNKIHHLNCYQDKCHYGSYHCLHDDRSIVQFCENFNQCDEHTRHIAKINDPIQGGIDIYEVPCPKGYVQPNINHSCFEPCIPDRSSAQVTIEYEPLDPHSDNDGIPHHYQLNITESPTSVSHDKTGDSKHSEGLQENGLTTGELIITCILVFIILLVAAVAVKVVWTKKLVRKTKYTKRETTNNILNVNNPNSVTINVGNDNQSVPLLEVSDVNDNDTDAKDRNNDHAMEDLKDIDRQEETMEAYVPTQSTDLKSFYDSQTQLKRPPSL